MKLIRTKNYKLFKHNLLQLQVYSIKSSSDEANLSNQTLEQIQVYLKQVLKVIFEYHVHSLKILFVGFPVICKTKQLRLARFTNHNFISEKSWISGFFRNRFSILTYLKIMQSQNFSKSLRSLLGVTTKPHLVVIFNHRIETNTINEFYKAGIPILSFDWNSLNMSKIAYTTLGNYAFTERKMQLTFFSLLYSLLKTLPVGGRKGLREGKQRKTIQS